MDTTDIPAACKPVSQEKIKLGHLAADPSARWRRKKRGELDVDAPVRVERAKKGMKTEDKTVFGYGAVTVGGTHENYGYVYGFDLIAANEYDVPASLKVMDGLREVGYEIKELIGDRGFSQAAKWRDGVRSRGAMPIFDLKIAQGDRDPDWKGCLVLQGWPYLPQLPKRLWKLTRPGLSAPQEKLDQFRKDLAERELYALMVHGRPDPHGARVTSPLHRNRRLGCPKVPGSMRKRDPKLAICGGGHGDNEACGIGSATFKSEVVPQTFQYPVWGTEAWAKKYAKRTNVERGFSSLKNPDVIGLTPGLYRMRGLVKMSILVACMWVAHNLHLRIVDEERQAKGLPRLPRASRRRPKAQPEQGLLMAVAASAPREVSRAP